MSVNKQRRQIILGSAAGTIGAFLGSGRTQAAGDEQRPDCSGLPADVSAARTWLALRFANQDDGNANMLAPILPGRKTTTVDDVLRYGIFCTGYKALGYLVHSEVKFQGAAAAVEQPEILFEDFKLENPKKPEVEVHKRAKVEEAEYRRRLEAAGATPEQLIQGSLMYWQSSWPRPGELLVAFKFRGQTHGTAGFAVSSLLSSHLNNSIATSRFFRNLDDIRLWRLQCVDIDFPGGTDLPYARGFKEEELGGMPREPRV